MDRSTRRRTAAAAVVLAVACTLPGCTGDDTASPPPSETSEPTPGATKVPTGPPDVELKVGVGTVTGDLPKARRREVSRRVGRTVDRWFHRAWVGGEFPRGGFGRKAFPAFTRGAWRKARRNRRMLTSVALADRIDDVVVRRRDVTVDVLAARGHPAGATARFRLRFRTSGDAERRVVVRGQLQLMPLGDGRWRIFGYDVARDVQRPRARGTRKGRDD